MLGIAGGVSYYEPHAPTHQLPSEASSDAHYFSQLLGEPAGTILLHGLEVGLHLGPLVEALDLRERQDLLLRAHLGGGR